MIKRIKTANIINICAFIVSAMLISSSVYAQDSANGLIYHGRVLKPNGDALEDANVNFTVRVYGTEAAPVAKRCLLYEETHSGVNMVGSLGTFELKIGEGTRTFTPPQIGVGGIGRLFLNSPSFTLTTTSCTAGTNDFTAESLDADRELEVTIQSGATVLNLPAQKLRAMPWAMQAMEIGGYSADYLAKLNAAVPNQMNAAALMYLSNNAVVNDNGTPTNYADDTVRLQNLINPTNPQDAATKDYVDTIVGSGYSAGNGVSISSGVVSTRVDNTTIEFDGSGIMRVKALGIGSSHIADGAITAVKLNQMSATPGQVLKWNGSAWAPAADDDSATVYTAGDGLALTGSDFSVNVDNTTVELNSDTLRVKDGGISFAKLNSAGGTVNDGLLVKDSSGRIFNLQCAANQVANWTMSNGWECINPSSLVGVQSTTLTQNNIWVGNASNVAAAQALPTCGVNQYITYNGTAWSCATDAGASGAVASAQGTAAVKVNGDNAAHTGAVTISVDDATVAAKGLMQVGNGLQVAAGVVSVSAPTCTAGQYISYNGTTWACSAPTDNDTTYTAGDALTLTGNDFDVAVDNTTIEVNADALRVKALGIDTAHLAAGSVTAAKLNQMGAAGNEVLKWNGSAWAPAADAGITAVAGQTLNQHQVWQGNVSNVAAAITIPSCGANQYLKYNNAGGWTCENDAGASGTVADIASTAPVKVNGGTTAQTGSVTVSVDDATASSKGVMQVGTGLSVASGTVSANFGSLAGTVTEGNDPRLSDARTPGGTTLTQNNIWMGNGSNVAAAILVPTCGANNYLTFNGTSWSCSVPTDNNSTYTAGNGLALTASDFAVNVDDVGIEINSDTLRLKDAGVTAAKLNQMGAAGNEVLKWNGSAWAPAADAGITAVAGQPLNQHQVWLGNVSNVAAATTLPNCGANQVLKYDNASGFTCQNDAGASGTVADISSTAPVKVNGGTTAQTGSVAITVDDATASTKGIMQVGTGLSVSSGTVSVDYSGIVRNIAGTPSIETGTFGTRPAFGTAGRIYIASDTNAIYRDTGSAWVLIGDGTGTGDVTDVTVSAPLAVTNSSGPNPNVSITAGGATGDVLQWNGSAWANTTVATCAGGQYLTYNGTTWACSAPAGTAYTAGDGLSLTANDFDINVDNSTVEVNSDTLRVRASGITTNEIADGTVAIADLNSNTYSTVEMGDRLVMRDSSGNTDAAGASMDMAILKGSTSGTVSLQAPTAPTSYALTFPSAQGGSGQVLQNNGSGVLSWVTPAGTMGGSGTTNKVPVYTAATTLGDSQITDNGASGVDFANSKIQFGGSSFIQVLGTQNISIGQLSIPGAVSGTYNTSVGFNASAGLTSGGNNSAFGQQALKGTTTGSNNASFGGYALWSNSTGSNSSAFGAEALYSATSGNNTAVGYQAGRNIAAGSNNVALGVQAGYNANGASTGNLFLGYSSGPTGTGAISNKLYIDNSANDTPLVGGDFSANTVDINGSLNINFAGGYLNYKPNATECTNNDTLRWDSTNDRWLCQTPASGVGGSGTTNRVSIFTAASTLGDSQITDNGASGVSFANSKIQFNGTLTLHSFGSGNLGLGASALNPAASGSSNIALGGSALSSVTTGSNNTASGGGALGALTTGLNNTASGINAMNSLVSGVGNTAIGLQAGSNANGGSSNNVFIGYSSGPTAAGAVSNKLYIDNSANNTPLIGGDFSANTVDINGSLNIAFAGGYLNYKPNNTACSDNDYLKWDNSNNRWICATPSGGVGGSGTTGMIPKFSAASTIADSSIQDEGGGVIDFTGAGAKIKFNNVDFIRRLANDNIGIGQYAAATATGVGNIAVGTYALSQVGTGYANAAIDGQYSNLTGYGNISMGVHALHFNTASNLNTGLGYYAGENLTGGSNTAVGANAITAIVAGSNNTALGKDAGLNANGASTGNLFLGGSSGPTAAGAISNKLYIDNSANNTPLIGGDFSANTVDINGSLNIAFAGGYLNYKPNNTACSDNDYLKWDNSNNRWICATPSGGMGGSGTTGRIPRFTASTTLGDSSFSDDGNGGIAVNGTAPVLSFGGSRILHLGGGAPSSDNNTFVGVLAGNTSLSGSANNGLGYGTLLSLTTGSYNVALGNQAMRYVTTGTSNVGVGAAALQSTNTGSQNTGLGDSAGYGNTSGAGNVAVGFESMDAKTTGDDNVAIGRASLGTLATGGTNVAVGNNAGSAVNGASSGNVFLGYGAGPTGAGAISNKLYIDNSANDNPLIYGDFSANRVGINTGSPSEALDVTGNVRATSFISTSDRRLKQNIRPIAGMSAINQLRGVQYEWRADGTADAGVIAQEVEKVFPNAVRTNEVTGFKAVKYNYLIAPLIEATKENYNMCKQSEAQIKNIQRSLASIQAKDSAQDEELQALRAENAALKQRLDAIEKKLGLK